MRRNLSITTALALILVLTGALGGLVQRISAAEGTPQDTVPAGQPWGFKVLINSHCTAVNHVRLEIVDNEKLRVTVRGPSLKDRWHLSWTETGAHSLLLLSGSFDCTYDRSNGSYSGEVDLVKNLPDSIHDMAIRLVDEKRGTSVVVITHIFVVCRAGNVFFLPSPAYEDNCVAYAESSRIDPETCLEGMTSDPKVRTEIESLANAIIADASTDYERLFRIHDWVAENIYYNWDAYRSGDYGDQSPHEILRTKKAVCSGYARLTEALLRSVGIPSRVIDGYALGAGTDGGARWDSIEHADHAVRANHAWNEAYVDGRWLIMDVTWDSLNKFDSGKFIKGGVRHDYFDMTLEYLSMSHRIRFSP